MSGILRATMPESTAGALSGPSFALEVAQGMPGAIVAAHPDPQDRQENPASVSSSGFPGLYQRRCDGGRIGRRAEKRGGDRGRRGRRTGLWRQCQGGADYPGDGGNPAAGGGVRRQRGNFFRLERFGRFDRHLLFAPEPQPQLLANGSGAAKRSRKFWPARWLWRKAIPRRARRIIWQAGWALRRPSCGKFLPCFTNKKMSCNRRNR